MIVISNDPNFWKDAYQDKWDVSSEREETVKRMIVEQGFEVKSIGFGACSEDYLSGKPEKYGYKKADPDLLVKDTNTHLEVTGTDVESVKRSDDIWVRPDKVRKIIKNQEMDLWIVHSIDHENLLRCIHMTEETAKELDTEDRIVHPYIRGNKETYISISPDEDYIEPVGSLFEHLENKI